MQTKETRLALISVDQMKAFDRVLHNFLFKTLDKFNFGPEFQRWIRLLYTDVSSSVSQVASDLLIGSRFDSFLISRYLCAQLISCETRQCVYSDHEFVFLELNLHTATPRGPSVWKFNNSLLRDEKFCSAIFDLITQFLRFRSLGPDGLTVEFYAFFWGKLGETLVHVFNQSLDCGCVQRQMGLRFLGPTARPRAWPC